MGKRERFFISTILFVEMTKGVQSYLINIFMTGAKARALKFTTFYYHDY